MRKARPSSRPTARAIVSALQPSAIAAALVLFVVACRSDGLVLLVMNQRLRLILLLCALLALVAWAWYTDRPSPAYPKRRFSEIVGSGLCLASVAGALAVFVARRRRDTV